MPDGTEYKVDRGAEQGDPLGSLKAALTLAKALGRTRERMRATRGEEPAYADMWYIDDGQVFIAPELVDPFLRTLDEELAPAVTL